MEAKFLTAFADLIAPALKALRGNVDIQEELKMMKVKWRWIEPSQPPESTCFRSFFLLTVCCVLG